MHAFLEELLVDGPLLADGAFGTQLQARGLAQGASPDAWNLTHPDRVEEVFRSYVEAGSQIVLTNTFQANRMTLSGHGLIEQMAEINRAGIEISRRAADDRAHVFASMGPSGKMLCMGQVSEGELSSVFAEQAKLLAAAGPDALVIETMSDVAEAKLAVVAAKETGLPVIVSMVFDSGKDNDRTMMGTTPEQAAEELLAAGADVIGANCGQGPESYVAVCRRLHVAGGGPIWIKPNAGLPRMDDGQIVYDTSPKQFAGYATDLIAAGACFVGGCCGTTPDYIRALKQGIQP
jgi:methionine synthase I (cobalamin-dependent)